MKISKKVLYACFLLLFFSGCEEQNKSRLVTLTVDEVRHNFDRYNGQYVSLVGFLVRSTDGRNSQDYVLYYDKNHVEIKSISLNGLLGINLSADAISKGSKLENNCLNSWVEVVGKIERFRYAKALPSINIGSGDVINIETETTSMCKWIN